MEKEILDFAAEIGAVEPTEEDSYYHLFRKQFRERNYFKHEFGFLIIKISRSKRPFYGLTKEILDFLNEGLDYKVIFLKSSSQGWVFNKEEISHYIKSKQWKLDSSKAQFKVNFPFPDSNFFFGPKGCLKRLGRNEMANK